MRIFGKVTAPALRLMAAGHRPRVHADRRRPVRGRGRAADTRRGPGALALRVLVQPRAAAQVPARLGAGAGRRPARRRAARPGDRRPRLVERRHRGHRPAGLAAGPAGLAGVRAAGARAVASAPRGEPVGMDLGSAAVRLSPEGEAEVVWGRRLDPARIEVLSHPAAVLRAALGRGRAARRGAARRADHGRRARPTPSSTRSSCGRPRPCRPGWCCWRRPPRPTGTPWSGWRRDAGFAAEDWSSSVRLLCRTCSESRMPSRRGRRRAPRPARSQRAGASGPARAPHGRAAVGRRSGSAAWRRPAGLVRGLLDGWVADSPDTRDWRDLEEVC